MEFNFSPEEVRVLGCLIEKQITTPDQYPMTLNYTRIACNQKSSREPVVEYDDDTVQKAFDKLKSRGITLYRSEHGSRTIKFEHLFPATFKLDNKETAALCVLLLRGPQTAGEIKTRCSRLHEFSSNGELEEVLVGLSQRERPLVSKLPKLPGRKEARYIHLLSGEPQISEITEHAEPAIEIVQVDTSSETEKLTERVTSLEGELQSLREEFESFKKQFE